MFRPVSTNRPNQFNIERVDNSGNIISSSNNNIDIQVSCKLPNYGNGALGNLTLRPTQDFTADEKEQYKAYLSNAISVSAFTKDKAKAESMVKLIEGVASQLNLQNAIVEVSQHTRSYRVGTVRKDGEIPTSESISSMLL